MKDTAKSGRKDRNTWPQLSFQWEMQNIRDIIRRSIEATDEHMLEIQNSACSMVVGLIFIVNAGRLYSRSPMAYQMFEVMPAWVWGLIYLGAGAMHLYCLADGRQTLRKSTLLIKASLWMFLGTAFIAGIGWWAVSSYIYFIFSLTALRGYFKIQIGAE